MSEWLDEESGRIALVEYSRRVYAKGWVANHDGNLSVRVGEDRIIATPTATSKGDIRPEMLIVVDMSGRKREGTRRPFSEFSIHLAAYRARPDIRAVLHAHPVTATAFALAGIPLEPTIMAETVVSLGACIPTTPFALPFGEEGARPLEPFLEDSDAFLLEGHGALTIAPDLETAFLRMELLEHLAKIQKAARELGSVQRLDPHDIEALLTRRHRAGLGAAARREKHGHVEQASLIADQDATQQVLTTISTQTPRHAPMQGEEMRSPCSGDVRAPLPSAASSPSLSADTLRALIVEEARRVLED